MKWLQCLCISDELIDIQKTSPALQDIAVDIVFRIIGFSTFLWLLYMYLSQIEIHFYEICVDVFQYIIRENRVYNIFTITSLIDNVYLKQLIRIQDIVDIVLFELLVSPRTFCCVMFVGTQINVFLYRWSITMRMEIIRIYFDLFLEGIGKKYVP